MLKLENIPPEEMPQVVRIATQLQEQDRQTEAEEQQRQATVAAAEEVGLPEHYLHQAAAELHTRRVAQIELQRRRRTRLITAGVGITAVGVVGSLLLLRPQVSAPPAPHEVSAVQAPFTQPFVSGDWMLKTSAGTQASVSISNAAGSATVTVQKFTPDARGSYFANLNAPLQTHDLSGFRSASFQVNGTLPNVRLYLENGQERWRSPLLKVGSDAKTVHVDFGQFERQLKQPDGVSWRNVRYEPPASVENVSLKLGAFVNEASATGSVTFRDLKFE